MPNWKKVIVSGSVAAVSGITASNVPDGDAGESVLTINSEGAIRKVAQGNLTGVQGGGADNDWYVGATALTSSKDIQVTSSIYVAATGSFVNGGILLEPHTSTEIFVEGNITSSGEILSVGNITSQGNIIAEGDVIAKNYIVSSSVTYMTQSFSTGNTVFGDDITDTHIFSGSIFVTGGLTYNTDTSINNVLIYDTTSGRFYYTGSYGGGGGLVEGGADTDWFEAATYLTASKSVYITGSTDQSTLTLKSTRPTGSKVFTVVGSSSAADTGPELFSVKDVTSGSIFTLNDISGLPVFDVDSNGKIIIDGNIEFGGYNNNGNILVSSTSDLNNFTTAGETRGDIVRFGGLGSGNPGELVYWNGTSWNQSTQTNAASGSLLGVLLGSSPSSDGVLLRGVVRINNTVTGGQQLYISNTAGGFTTTLPTTSGYVVRAVGHSMNNHVIYFNPSPDFLKID